MDRINLLAALLEFADAARAVYPSDAILIPSARVVFLWDARDDADAGIMAAVATHAGGEVVCERIHVCDDGRSILGLFAEPTGESLDDYLADVRTRYLCATGPDPETLEPPF